MGRLKNKLKSAAAKRKRRKNTGVAKAIGKKALKAGLVAGTIVAAQVAVREVAVRRGLVKRKAV
jgi:hypothetical protein